MGDGYRLPRCGRKGLGAGVYPSRSILDGGEQDRRTRPEDARGRGSATPLAVRGQRIPQVMLLSY